MCIVFKIFYDGFVFDFGMLVLVVVKIEWYDLVKVLVVGVFWIWVKCLEFLRCLICGGGFFFVFSCGFCGYFLVRGVCEFLEE